MELDWYCTGAVYMKQESCWGVLRFFKRPQVSLLKKQRNWQHDICCLITNTWANRVAIVRSVIARSLTLPNIGWSPFSLQYLFIFSASVLIVILSLSVNLLLFVSCYFSPYQLFQFVFIHFCLITSCFVWLFDYSVSFSVLILELYSRYFDPT